MLVVDSREKWVQPGADDLHISKYFDKHGIAYEVRKLDIGDYMLDTNPALTVDRKASLEELARNLMNRADSSRFWREVRRAHEAGVKLVILCEHGHDVRTIMDVPKWKSRYTRVTGRALLDEMIRLEMAYGVVWRFCNRRETGKRIVEILTEGRGAECQMAGGSNCTVP